MRSFSVGIWSACIVRRCTYDCYVQTLDAVAFFIVHYIGTIHAFIARVKLTKLLHR